MPDLVVNSERRRQAVAAESRNLSAFPPCDSASIQEHLPYPTCVLRLLLIYNPRIQLLELGTSKVLAQIVLCNYLIRQMQN